MRIIEFIDKCEASDEEVATTSDGTTLLVRQERKKIRQRDISPAQWIVGNARIQHELMLVGRLEGWLPKVLPITSATRPRSGSLPLYLHLAVRHGL